MHLSISRFAYVDYNIHACIVHSVRYASAPPDAFISNSLIQISYCMHSLCHCYYGTMSDEWCANVEHPATINQCSVQRAACSVQRVLYITWTKNCGRLIRHTFLCSVASSVQNFCTFWHNRSKYANLCYIGGQWICTVQCAHPSSCGERGWPFPIFYSAVIH